MEGLESNSGNQMDHTLRQSKVSFIILLPIVANSFVGFSENRYLPLFSDLSSFLKVAIVYNLDKPCYWNA